MMLFCKNKNGHTIYSMHHYNIILHIQIVIYICSHHWYNFQAEKLMLATVFQSSCIAAVTTCETNKNGGKKKLQTQKGRLKKAQNMKIKMHITNF